MKKNGEKGQILLIILLIMVVGLTTGLSLATRSVSDIKVSTGLEESSRAFSAAEAGIEAALKGESPPPLPVLLGNASYSFTKSAAGGNDQMLNLNTIYIADTFTVWLTSHDASNGNLQLGTTYDYTGTSIDLCWQRAAGATVDPAMEITVIYNDGTDYKIERGSYDPTATRRSANNFAIPSIPGTCSGFSFGQTINMPSIGASGYLVAMRLRPFYANADVTIIPQQGCSPACNLPSQGLIINSTGNTGQTSRKVSVLQSYPALPAIFDYVLFSGADVSKN